MRESLLDGDVAVVTGGAGGIGRAIATHFSKEGAEVVVADVDVDGGKATVDQIERDDGSATFVETDVSDPSDVRHLFDVIAEEQEQLDVLVNNAGGSLGGDDNLHHIDEATWDRSVDVNLKGTFLCAKEALPLMVESGGGRMVHLSSVNALTGIGLTAYSAAKAGILSLSQNIANQYGRHGIRSNVICPGTIETESRRGEMESSGGDPIREEWIDQYPLARFGKPDEVADAALYLASEMSSFVTGSELVIDGGLTCGLDHTLEQLVYNVDETPSRG